MKAAIYTRFSSDNQTELSTQAQVRACTEFANGNGMDIYYHSSNSDGCYILVLTIYLNALARWQMLFWLC